VRAAIGAVTGIVLILTAACGGDDAAGKATAPPTGVAAASTAQPSATGSVPGATAAAAARPDVAPGVPGNDYSDPGTWLCRPGKENSPCTASFDTTVRTPDGKATVEIFTPAANPPIDCFYVYPTVSTDSGANSDMTAGVAEAGTARAQAARFGQYCRVFAPVYRQATTGSITTGRYLDPTVQAIAYGDVLAAWKQYLAQDNKGRGVVLIGHSQGSKHLVKLIREEIDPKPEARALLVSAIILGGVVSVPVGADTGGDFQNIGACRKPEQTGCVVTYSSFSAESPPPANGLFARSFVPGQEALCVNPAAPAGGPASFHPDLPTAGNPTASTLPTAFVSDLGAITGECVKSGPFNYLKVTAAPALKMPAYYLGPEWGLHLIDAGLTQGDLVDLVGKQAAAFTAR
jgi:hypothetical protein